MGILTVEDYMKLPLWEDSGKRFELFKGTLLEMAPSATKKHQVVSNILDKTLDKICPDLIILPAPMDLILDKKVVVQPDLIIMTLEKFKQSGDRIDVLPNLVVEVLSPSNKERDLVDKFKLYKEYKIPEYWIVDIDERTLTQHYLTENMTKQYNQDDYVNSRYLCCIHFKLADVFRLV